MPGDQKRGIRPTDHSKVPFKTLPVTHKSLKRQRERERERERERNIFEVTFKALPSHLKV